MKKKLPVQLHKKYGATRFCIQNSAKLKLHISISDKSHSKVKVLIVRIWCEANFNYLILRFNLMQLPNKCNGVKSATSLSEMWSSSIRPSPPKMKYSHDTNSPWASPSYHENISGTIYAYIVYVKYEWSPWACWHSLTAPYRDWALEVWLNYLHLSVIFNHTHARTRTHTHRNSHHR